MSRKWIGIAAAAASMAAFQSHAQGIPTPGHKCVYNCDAPASPSSPETPGMGAAMGAALGAAIVRSIANQRQREPEQQQGTAPDNAQATAAARQALDSWASDTADQANYAGPRQGVAGQLDQWANEVQREDLRDAPNSDMKQKGKPKRGPQPQAQVQLSTQSAALPTTIPDECVESGQSFDNRGKPIGHFYQCWPKDKDGHALDKYCLKTSTTGALEDVPCNTESR